MKKPIRVGIIGTGKFAGHHSKVWQSVENVKLIGIYGSNPERSVAFAREHGTEHFVDLAQLMEVSDLIDVVSTNDTHGDYALKAILAGCHVIIEKPLDIEVKKAKEVCAAAHEKGIVASVVSQFRFNPCFRKMKQVLESGGIGDVLGGQITVISPRSEAYYSHNGGWRADPIKVGGGVLIHQCIHHIDLLHWLLGEVTYARGCSSNWTGGQSGHGVERTFLALLEFASGIPVQLFLTTRGEVGLIEQQRIEIFSSRAVASSNGRFFSTTGLPSFRRMFNAVASRFGLISKAENTNAHLRRQFTETVSAILGKGSLSVSLEDGLRALETVDRLYRTDSNFQLEQKGDSHVDRLC
jgi:predicted dehydrogenase